MGEPVSYDEIAIVLAPSSLPASVTSWEETADKLKIVDIRAYDAFIYTNLKVEDLKPIDPKESVPHKSIGKLPLAAREQVVINWTHYQSYILAYFLGEKSARKFLRNVGKQKDLAEGGNVALFGVKGNFLERLFAGKLPGNKQTRVWWHSDLPELVALPWELLAYERFSTGNAPFYFLRGLPPQTNMPRVPVSGPLRVAFIHEPRTTSNALLQAFRTPPANIKVTPMTDAPREALLTAAREGYEIVHLVSDGTVSLGNDGTLYLRKGVKHRPDRSIFKDRLLRALLLIYDAIRPVLLKLFAALNSLLRALFDLSFPGVPLVKWLDRKLESQLDIDKCSPSELNSILHGSRVSILCFSAPKSTDTDPGRIDGYLLPKVYRAFCSLGSSLLPLPTIVAPVGATDDPEMTHFWQGFYTGLAEHLDTTKAMESGLKGEPPVAMALFQRHPETRMFAEVSAEQQKNIVDPTQLDAALQLSEELVRQLIAQFGQVEAMPESFQKLCSKELERQARLKAQLEPWIQTGA